MVAKISTGKDVYGALAYNQQKVDKGGGAILTTNIIREPADGRFSVAETAEDLLRWMPSHYRTEKPVVHISLNPDPADHLTDEQLADIAQKYMERMGWGGQPYIVFKHTDIDREHIHIVTVQVARDGRKINDSMRNERSMTITEQLEEEYGLRPAKGQTRSKTWQFTPVDYTESNLKKQIAAVVKNAATKYRFQSLGEFRALLSLYSIGIEEVSGERDGIQYKGLIYVALDENGEKANTPPLKSSLFGKTVGPNELERRMERSAEKIKNDNSRERTRHRVAEAMLEATSEETLRERLKDRNIDLFLRRNDTGRIVGVTFIDHENHCVMNGSRLGKEFSANALQERYGNSPNKGTDQHGIATKPDTQRYGPNLKSQRKRTR